MEALDHLLRAADKYGFSVVVAVILFVFAYRAGKWFGGEFIIPVREAVKQYLSDMTAWNRSLGKTLDEVKEDYAAHHAWETERSNGHDQKLDRILDKVTRRPPRSNSDMGDH